MKTAEELINWIHYHYEQDLGYKEYSLLSKTIKEFESDIRAEKQETRIKELTSMGEFKTMGQASEYCRLHGIDSSKVQLAVFTISGALMDARKDQDKICRHAHAEKSMIIPEGYDKKSAEWTNGFLDATKMIHASIMNTKAL